jgi:hypothetical protein
MRDNLPNGVGWSVGWCERCGVEGQMQVRFGQIGVRELKSRLAPMAAVVGLLVLAGCTTLEGTNAFVDGNTFEREVVTETLIGVGLMPREEKEKISAPRGPLVMPIEGAALPAPRTSVASALPVDSDKVNLDTTGLSAADVKRIRSGLVVEKVNVEGRGLTPAEAKVLAERYRALREARAARSAAGGGLFEPPERLFTKVGSQEFICLTPSGDLVSLEDPACPPDIKAALAAN